MNSDKFNIIVVSGPSGSGKSTLVNRLLSEEQDIAFAVSHTTRPKRDNEINGKHYYFVNETKFKEMIANNEFIEWAEVYRQFYGTSLAEIERKASAGKNLVLDVDVQGAGNIKTKFPHALLIFIAPPNLQELKKRLLEREKRSGRDIENRLNNVKKELENYCLYDYIVINDKLEEAYAALKSIYTAFNHSRTKKKQVIEKMITNSEIKI